jgi:hypothetical protein
MPATMLINLRFIVLEKQHLKSGPSSAKCEKTSISFEMPAVGAWSLYTSLVGLYPNGAAGTVFRKVRENDGRMKCRCGLNILGAFARTRRKRVPAMVFATMCIKPRGGAAAVAGDVFRGPAGEAGGLVVRSAGSTVEP